MNDFSTEFVRLYQYDLPLLRKYDDSHVPLSDIDEYWAWFLSAISYVKLMSTEARSDGIDALIFRLGDRLKSSPASGSINRHGCWEGGLLMHTCLVTKLTMKMAINFSEDVPPDGTFRSRGIPTENEILFSGLFHDLGKVGSIDKPRYTILPLDDWRRRRGDRYDTQGKFPTGRHEDYSMQLLSEFGIPVTPFEMQAILYHSMAFFSGFKDVFHGDESNLMMWIHYADMFVARNYGV